MNKLQLTGLFLLSFVCALTKLSAFNNDSTKTVPVPKHYFGNTIYIDDYATGTRQMDTANAVSKKLKTYQVKQLSIGFNVPVVTKDFYNKDSTQLSNIHFLLTGNYSRIKLNFGGIPAHDLSKLSLGFRGIYNTGKRGIFFLEFTPFVTRDNGYAYTRTYRTASTFLYDYSVSPAFSFRLGYTRSFAWGNRFNLPYLGIRIGKLDKINFSVQFPRSVTFTVPMGVHVRFGLYTKSQGGLYSFANTDSIPVGNEKDKKKLFFGRNEFLSGARFDILPTKHFAFYISTGFTTRNNIAFYPTSTVNRLTPYNEYYEQKIKGGIFLNFGLVFRFGKTKSIYNNSQMYDAMDMNNNANPGDTNLKPGNGNIPPAPKKMPRVSTEEVRDLIDAQDTY